MKSGKAHQVECLTCRAQHLWRPNDAGRTAGGLRRRRRDRPRAAGGGASDAHASRLARRRGTSNRGSKRLNGRGVHEFKAYSVGASFQEGDLVRHKKFGDGVVTRVIDGHKVEVLFRDEARTLAQSMN